MELKTLDFRVSVLTCTYLTLDAGTPGHISTEERCPRSLWSKLGRLNRMRIFQSQMTNLSGKTFVQSPLLEVWFCFIFVFVFFKVSFGQMLGPTASK